MKRKKIRTSFTQRPLIQGEPVVLEFAENKSLVWGLGCCDCGLYHQFIMSLDGRRLMLRPYRDEFLTALAHEEKSRKKK